MSDRPKELLAQAFESAPISLSLSDLDGHIVAGNRAFWSLFGHTEGRPLDVVDLTRPDDLDWTSSYLEQLVSGELDTFRTVKRFVRADGSEFDADLTVRALHDGDDCVGMVASVEPTETRPKIDDVRIRKLLEHAAGTLTLIDAEGRVLETSGRYRTTLGYPEEFWEHRTIFDVLVPEDAERVLAMRDDVLTEPGREVTGDFRVVAADRHIETLQVSATNLLHEPGVEGIVISSRNVTTERADRRAVEAQHDDAVAEADRRSHLLATVSHELRNPLHAMSGMAELLASDPGLSVEQHDLASAIERQLLRLVDVTDDLLDAARLDVGEFRIQLTAVDLRDLVDDVVRSARAAAGDRLRVDVDVADDVPFTIESDPARLQQIIGNLLGNAVKFTETGSVDLTVAQRDDMLHLAVADTGPGIPDEHRSRVFEAFATVPGGGGRSGAGLGLAIVRRLVGALGGEISMFSEVGVGTTFHVSLPLRVLRTSPQPDESSAGPERVPRRVLVVEDTPVNQDLARAQLARLGVECVIAGTAEDGLVLLDEQRFDAVLMDHQLPGMNGREATVEIRRRGLTLPVIGITASSTAADERASLDAGMTAFLPKPVGLKQLGDALDRAVTESGDDAMPEPGEAGDGPSDAVDVAVLERLVDELGERAIVEQLVRSFLDELAVRSDDVGGDDPALAARQAHTLKSSSRLLGAHRLADACAEAETDAARRREVVELADDARRDLTAWLDGPASGAGTDPEPNRS